MQTCIGSWIKNSIHDRIEKWFKLAVTPVLQKLEEEQQAAVAAKLEQQRLQSTFLETTRLQVTDLQQKNEASAAEAQRCQAAIRGKADVAKQEREK